MSRDTANVHDTADQTEATHEPNVWAVVLSAGASTRMGYPKALARVPYATLLSTHIDTYGALLAGVIVVLGCHERAIREGCDLKDASVVLNPQWAQGQASSVAAGLAALPAGACALLTPVDCPPVSHRTVDLLIQALAGASAVVPMYEGRTGHPVGLSSSTARALLRQPGYPRLDGFLSGLTPAVVHVETGDPSVCVNINNPEELSSHLKSQGCPELKG